VWLANKRDSTNHAMHSEKKEKEEHMSGEKIKGTKMKKLEQKKHKQVGRNMRQVHN
jgi:hypothetical protein